jgi:hypothetical protein
MKTSILIPTAASIIVFGFVSSALAVGKTPKETATSVVNSMAKKVSVSCDNEIKLAGLDAHATQISFTEKKDTTQAKLNGIEECKQNEGKSLCYHANGETMINIPLDIGAKKKGDSVTVFINDDADDVVGNGKAYLCKVD